MWTLIQIHWTQLQGINFINESGIFTNALFCIIVIQNIDIFPVHLESCSLRPAIRSKLPPYKYCLKKWSSLSTWWLLNYEQGVVSMVRSNCKNTVNLRYRKFSLFWCDDVQVNNKYVILSKDSTTQIPAVVLLKAKTVTYR